MEQTRITIISTKEKKKELKRILIEKDMTISDLLNSYIDDYINKNKNKNKQWTKHINLEYIRMKNSKFF